ncbi:fungal-specific transcription factor domain-containing protein [Endogone sp. FLAS-F59071]|nr:fungal-specific transcription factor domain-containing protein [Endogone sp. FLAS-F59071]|eukprot:RUS13959.1 fungal-specific transcription factor domain-containing protein [Endogone sp. FLAS-F59071]
MGELHSSIVKLKDMIVMLESRMTLLERATGEIPYGDDDDEYNKYGPADPPRCIFAQSSSSASPHATNDRKKARQTLNNPFDDKATHSIPRNGRSKKKDQSPQPLQWALTYSGKGISIEANVQNLGDLGHMIDQFRSAVKDAQNPETVKKPADNTQIDDEEEQKRREACFESKETPMNPQDSFISPANNPQRELSVFPQVTDHLIYAFFERSCCHLPLPLLDKRSFLDRYHDTKDPAPPVLVYAVCAPSAIFACRIHYPPTADYGLERAHELANAYSYKAWELLENQFDCSDITTIQSILYLLFFSNNCHGRPYSWGIQLTLAIRMAFDCDLHREETYPKLVRRIGPARTEEARRTFWAIFNHATWVALSMGSKSVMDDARITTELPYVQEDDETMNEDPEHTLRAYTPPELREGPLDSETRDIRLFFHQMSDLMQIYEQMQEARLSKTADESITAHLHSLLDGWFQSLSPQFEDVSPARLAVVGGDSNHLIIAIVWLHVHYYLGLIWLHQHFLIPGATFEVPEPTDPNTITPPTSPTADQLPRRNSGLSPAALSVSLSTCAHAAVSITTLTDSLVARRGDCQMSIHALFFSSNIYEKMLRLHLGQQWDDFAQRGMQHNIAILRASRSYDDGRELYVSFAKLMEEKARRAVAAYEEDRKMRMGMDHGLLTPGGVAPTIGVKMERDCIVTFDEITAL